MTAFVTSRDGTRIAYDKVGTGPALLVVNGPAVPRSRFVRRLTAFP